MLNKVHLIGNLSDDPTLVTLNNGTAATTFSLVTSEYWTDKKTQEKKSTPTWHTVDCYAKLAETVVKHTYKGMRVSVEGKILYDQWVDKETGEKKYRTKIIAHRILFLSRKDESSAQTNHQDVKAEADGNVTPTKDLQFPNDDISPNRAAWEKEKNRVADKVSGNKKKDAAPFIDDEIPF